MSEPTAAKPGRSGVYDAALAFGIRVASAFLTFGLQILLARLMPLDGYGGFVTLWTWLLALGSFAALGLAESSVRFLPRYRLRGRERHVQGYWRHGLTMVSASAFGFALLAIIGGLAVGIGTETGLLIVLFGVGLPFLALEYYLEGVARSFGWFQLTTVPVYIVRPILIATICIGLALSGIELSVAVVGSVLVGSMAAVAIGVTIVVGRRLRATGGEHATVYAPIGKRQRRLWLLAALPLLVFAGLDDLLAYADILIIGLMLSPEDVGFYFAAARCLSLASFVTFAIYLVSGRRFALDLAGQKREALQASVLAASSLTVWATVLAVGATLVAGPWLLAAFGPEFSGGYEVMVILGIGLVARSLAGQASEILIVTGRLRQAVLLALGAVVGNVVLTVALIPLFGLAGAAVATAIAMTGRSIALIAIVWASEGLRVMSLKFPALRRG